MTTANKITISRFFLIPIMILFMYLSIGNIELIGIKLGVNELVVAIIFVIAAFTDFLDGYYARKFNQITTFGKFLDPIADKVLVIAAMIYLVSISRISVWPVVLVIFREFLVTGIRLLAAPKGSIIAASPYGKIKTFATMIAIIMMLFKDFGLPSLISDVIWYVAIFFTLVSGVDYFIKNRQIVFESM